jgi:excisionase family DNA binding protein
MTTDEFLTLTEAADELGISRFKMSRLIRDGEIRAYVSPLNRKQKLVRRSDLAALKEPVPVEVEPGKAAPVAA